MRGRNRGNSSDDRWARHDWWGAAIDTPDPLSLARFYASLLDWEVRGGGDATSVSISPGEGVAYIGFEQVDDYEPPVWPGQAGKQRMMMHLSFEVSDLQAATAHAVELGARLAEYQPLEHARTLLDPDGHPFCLYAATSGKSQRIPLVSAATLAVPDPEEERSGAGDRGPFLPALGKGVAGRQHSKDRAEHGSNPAIAEQSLPKVRSTFRRRRTHAASPTHSPRIDHDTGPGSPGRRHHERRPGR